MKILVISDKEIHQKSAQQTLADHDLTIVNVYEEAYELLDFKTENVGSYNVLLSDLRISASDMNMGEKDSQYIGQGMIVVITPSSMEVRLAVEYVAAAMDTNYHDHPASAMLDDFRRELRRDYEPGRILFHFVINMAMVAYFHSPMISVEGTICTKCNGNGDDCYNCHNSGKQLGKDWGEVLRRMINFIRS